MAMALEAYVTADPEDLEAAWERLARHVGPGNIRLMADEARSARRALEAQLEELEELQEGAGPLLPVISGLDRNRFVVSTGRGAFDWVVALPDPQKGGPIIDAQELEERGPALAALDRSGSVIVDVYWPDENFDLFKLVLGSEEAHVAQHDETPSPANL
jgi:hypothetical protein